MTTEALTPATPAISETEIAVNGTPQRLQLAAGCYMWILRGVAGVATLGSADVVAGSGCSIDAAAKDMVVGFVVDDGADDAWLVAAAPATVRLLQYGSAR